MKGNNPYEHSDFFARVLSNVAREPYTVNALQSSGGSLQLSLASSQALLEFHCLPEWCPAELRALLERTARHYFLAGYASRGLIPGLFS
jgi:hypothetical protein